MRELLELNEVLTIIEDDDAEALEISRTNRVSELIDWMIEEMTVNEFQEDFMKTGLRCEILRTNGGGWKKGKVKIALVFEPDEPESPLDDIRKEMNQE